MKITKKGIILDKEGADTTYLSHSAEIIEVGKSLNGIPEYLIFIRYSIKYDKKDALGGLRSASKITDRYINYKSDKERRDAELCELLEYIEEKK